jgi:hypothetical protein
VSVKSKPGQNCSAPENRCPNSDCARKKPGHNDREKEAHVGPKKECGSTSQSGHGIRISGRTFKPASAVP